MPIQFDPNSLNSTFDKNFGAGAYNSGLQNAGNAARLKTQASLAKTDYIKRLQKAQQAALKPKKTYQDAISYWSDPTNKESLKNQGAYRAAEELKNDPAKQAEIKAQGYNVSDFVDAMYNAASDGKYRSEREYNGFASDLNKTTKAANKAKDKQYQDQYGMNYQDYYDFQQKQKQQQASQSQTKKGPSLLDDLKAAGKAVGQAVNPFDNVGFSDAMLNYWNRNPSDTFKNISRGSNRAVDSASLGLMSNLDKKMTGRTPDYLSQRAFGQGGGTDMITSGLGYLVPGLGATKAVKGIGLGAKAIPALAEGATTANKLVRGAKVAGQLAKEGAAAGGLLAGGEVGVREAINPNDQNWQQNLGYVGMGAGIGAVANPVLAGAGAALKNTGLGQRLMNALNPKTAPQQPELLGLPSPQTRLNAPQLQLPGPITRTVPDIPNNPTNIPGTPLLQMPREMAQIQKMTAGYQKELKDAVQKQYEYLKNSMGKGVDYGTTGTGLGNFREVNGSFSVSRNPQWYQDFYRLNGRKPNNKELMQMAEEHVKNGFKDEFGGISPYVPKSVQDIDNQIADIQAMIGYMPEQEAQLRPILSALQEDRSKVMNDYQQVVGIKPTNETVVPMNNNSNEPPLQFKTQKAFNTKQEPINYVGQMNPKDMSALKVSRINNRNTTSNPFEAISAAPKGKGYENISAAPKSLNIDGEAKFGTKLIDSQKNPNPFDVPYKPGDPLPDTRSQIGTKTAKTMPTIPEVANKGYIKTVDNLHRFDQFDSQVAKVLGRDLNASESTHTLGLNSRNSDVISHQILTENMVDRNGNVTGQSLKDITMKVPKGKLLDFEDYLVNKHAITRMNRGEKVFKDELKMSPAKSEAKVKEYEQQYPEFKKLAEENNKFNQQLGKNWLVDYGVFSKKQWESMSKANPDYVPNNRIFSNLEKPKFGNNAKRGFSNQSNPIKSAPGSQREIISPIESEIEHAALYVKTAKRNEVMQTLIHNIQQDPKSFEGWAEIVPTKDLPESLKMDMQKTLDESGIDGVLEEFNKAFNQKPDLTKGNIVRGLIDGNPVHVRVNDPELLNALTSLDPKAQHIIVAGIGKVTRVMKNLTTGINPVFSLTRNVFRDIPTSYINSTTTKNPLKFSYDLLDAFTSVIAHPAAQSKGLANKLPALSKLANNRADLYQQFRNVGGGHTSPISTDVNLLAQSKRSILPKDSFINGSNYYNQKPTGPIKKLVNTSKYYGGKALGALENLNNAVEAAPRLAEFKRLNGNTYNDKMNALYAANDVTVNFNKYGEWSKQADQLIPYFNAAVQGLDKLGRVFFSKSATTAQKTAAATKAFAAITVPSILMYYVNHNDPNYKNVSNYIKDSNILIPKGDGTFYKIPKPRELGPIFGSDVERLLRSWEDNDPQAFQDFGTNLWSNFALPTRTTFAPINDLRANKNFMNVPIVPNDLQNLPPQYQYDSKTSEVSKALGKLFNFSPMKSDYLIKSYGGVLGELGIPATAKNTTIGNTLVQKVSVDPVFSNDIQRRFYDLKTKLDQAHNAYTKQGTITSDMNEGVRKQMSNANTAMGKVRKLMKQAQNDTTLTPQERLDQVRQYQDHINQLAQQSMQNVR